MDIRNAYLSTLLLGSAILVTGCGGGGGSDAPAAPPANTTPVAISSANATTIAAAVLTGGNMAEGLGQMVPLKAGAAGHESRDASYQRIYDLALNNALKGLTASKTTVSVPVGVTPAPQPCSVSGTMSFGINDANGNGEMDQGESFSITYDKCVETLGTQTATSNGSFTFTLTTLSGDPSIPGTDYSFAMSFTMNLTETYSDTAGGSGSFTSSGGATFTAAYVAATTVASGSMSGTSLADSWSYSDPTYGSSSGSFELADFNFATSDNMANGSYTADIDYTLRADEIGGSVTVATNPAFAGIGMNPPTSGTMVISGADGSKITLVANSDGQTVTLTVNNDAPQTVTWFDLGGW